MRLAWFSPLPPAKTAIAENVLPVIAELDRVHTLDLWIPEGESVAQADRPVIRYSAASTPWQELNAADAAVYHIGNQAKFHGPIFRASQSHAGVVVLHDEALQHLFASELRQGSNDEYLTAMATHHGPDGLAAARRYLLGQVDILDLARDHPLTGHAIAGAAGVAVHHRDLALRLAAVTSAPIAYLPLAHLAAPGSRRTQPVTTRQAGGRWNVVVIGHLSPNRCLPQILRGMAEPGAAAFDLDIIGRVVDEEETRNRIAQLGLAGRVRIHGFVPDDELRRRLASANLAINLRNPTMGEASASQMTLWEHGLPTLVSRTGWYATLPESTVVHAPPGDEEAAVTKFLGDFAGSPSRFAEMGAEGRRILDREHTPRAYADGLVRLVEAAREYRACAAIERTCARHGQAAASIGMPALGGLARAAAELSRPV